MVTQPKPQDLIRVRISERKWLVCIENVSGGYYTEYAECPGGDEADRIRLKLTSNEYEAGTVQVVCLTERKWHVVQVVPSETYYTVVATVKNVHRAKDIQLALKK